MTGDGAPTLSFFAKADETYSPFLFNKTKYPIYDLRFRIDNFDEIVKCKTKIVEDVLAIYRECIDKNSQKGGPFFMAPGQSQGFNYFISKSQNLKHFRVQVITRKQIFTYLCVLHHSENLIRYRIRIYTSTDDYKLKLLDEKEQRIKSFDYNYRNEHFYADKKIIIGPIQ